MVNKKRQQLLLWLLIGIFLTAGIFLIISPKSKSSFLGSLLSRLYPQVTVNYSECEKDSHCVVGILLGACCSCPQAISKTAIGKDGWELYEPEKKYKRPIGCNQVCEQCIEPLGTYCENKQCLTKGKFDEFSQLATEYRSLRKIIGHFEGGEWNNAVDSFGGRKHQVMADLLEEINKQGFDKLQVLHYLGNPNEILEKNNILFKTLINLKNINTSDSEYEILVYYWRGGHDFIYFVTKGNEVVKSGWWYAGE